MLLPSRLSGEIKLAECMLRLGAFLCVCGVSQETLSMIARNGVKLIRSRTPRCRCRRVIETRNARFAGTLVFISLVESKQSAFDV